MFVAIHSHELRKHDHRWRNAAAASNRREHKKQVERYFSSDDIDAAQVENPDFNDQKHEALRHPKNRQQELGAAPEIEEVDNWNE